MMPLCREVRRHLIIVAWLLWCIAVTIAGEAADSTEPAPTLKSRSHGSPEPPEPYKIVSAFPRLRFTKPTCIEEIPGTGRLLITEMAGKIFSFPKNAEVNQADLVLDLIALLPKDLAGRGVS